MRRSRSEKCRIAIPIVDGAPLIIAGGAQVARPPAPRAADRRECAARWPNKHMATGNGGNLSIFIPDLDLVVAATGGNYSDRANFVMLTEIIPKYILPAILD